MGLLDFFGSRAEKQLKKHSSRVANKRAQNADRWESIHALGEMRTADAVRALIARFSYSVDPSITDQEEKEATVQAILKAGQNAVEPLIELLAKSESIAWPFKCLDQLVDDDTLTGMLLDVLSRMDTEYERDPEKKIQVLSALGERDDERIVEAARGFLEDVNETCRFHAVLAISSQRNAEVAREAMLAQLLVDESMRVRARVLDAFADHNWNVGDKRAEAVGKLPTGYVLDAEGRISRK